MQIEQYKAGKSAEQVIDEVEEDLNRGVFDDKEKKEIIAKLIVARITTRPGSPEQRKIDALLQDIKERYDTA